MVIKPWDLMAVSVFRVKMDDTHCTVRESVFEDQWITQVPNRSGWEQELGYNLYAVAFLHIIMYALHPGFRRDLEPIESARIVISLQRLATHNTHMWTRLYYEWWLARITTKPEEGDWQGDIGRNYDRDYRNDKSFTERVTILLLVHGLGKVDSLPSLPTDIMRVLKAILVPIHVVEFPTFTNYPA